jgi:hypothetical protein
VFSRKLRIRVATSEGSCPHCGSSLERDVPGSGRIGTARATDGVFCGVACRSAFYDESYLERIEQGFPTPT